MNSGLVVAVLDRPVTERVEPLRDVDRPIARGTQASATSDPMTTTTTTPIAHAIRRGHGLPGATIVEGAAT